MTSTVVNRVRQYENVQRSSKQTLIKKIKKSYFTVFIFFSRNPSVIISISKKNVRRAIDRNKIKRIIRDIYHKKKMNHVMIYFNKKIENKLYVKEKKLIKKELEESFNVENSS